MRRHEIECTNVKGRPKIVVKESQERQNLTNVKAKSKETKKLTQEEKIDLLLEQQAIIIDLLTS